MRSFADSSLSFFVFLVPLRVSLHFVDGVVAWLRLGSFYCVRRRLQPLAAAVFVEDAVRWAMRNSYIHVLPNVPYMVVARIILKAPVISRRRVRTGIDRQCRPIGQFEAMSTLIKEM